MHMQYHTRYDELELLRAELEQEDRARESLEWSNGELERSIAELEQYVRELDDSTRGIDDNEWKVRFESQVGMNKQLAEQKEWLETELAEARRKLTTGSYPEAMNFNLDALTEAELLRLVKHLERMRNDFYSTLRDTEWKLDKESKEFHHFDEMRRVYKSDLKHANSQIERLRLNVLDPSGMISPLYPQGYFRWIDSHTPGAPGMGGGKGSKSPTRKAGGSKGRKEERSPSRSPTRSKSRNEKKTKKKEEPPPEEVTTPNQSEGENENQSEEEEEEGETRQGKGHRSRGHERSETHTSPKKKQIETGGGDGGGNIKDNSEQPLPSPSRQKRESSKDRSLTNE